MSLSHSSPRPSLSVSLCDGFSTVLQLSQASPWRSLSLFLWSTLGTSQQLSWIRKINRAWLLRPIPTQTLGDFKNVILGYIVQNFFSFFQATKNKQISPIFVTCSYWWVLTKIISVIKLTMQFKNPLVLPHNKWTCCLCLAQQESSRKPSGGQTTQHRHSWLKGVSPITYLLF